MKVPINSPHFLLNFTGERIVFEAEDKSRTTIEPLEPPITLVYQNNGDIITLPNGARIKMSGELQGFPGIDSNRSHHWIVTYEVFIELQRRRNFDGIIPPILTPDLGESAIRNTFGVVHAIRHFISNQS